MQTNLEDRELGLVRELQDDAMDEGIPLATVLRRASVISKTLDGGSMDEWIALELGGYPQGVEKPAYRKVRGTATAHDAYAGWIPMRLPPEEWAVHLATVPFHQGVAALTSLLEKSDGQLGFDVPAASAKVFMDHDPDLVGLGILVADSGLVGVLNAIRQHVFDWALSLELKGIAGAGRSFARPQPNTQPVIHQMTTNNYENIHQSQIMTASRGAQTQSLGSDLAELLEVLREAQRSIGALQLSDEAKTVAEEDVATAITQACSPKPRAGILTEALRSVRTVLEGAAGNMLASDLLVRLAAAMRAAGIAG